MPKTPTNKIQIKKKPTKFPNPTRGSEKRSPLNQSPTLTRGLLNLHLGRNERDQQLTPPPRPPREMLLKWWPSAISAHSDRRRKYRSRFVSPARGLTRVCARHLACGSPFDVVATCFRYACGGCILSPILSIPFFPLTICMRCMLSDEAPYQGKLPLPLLRAALRLCGRRVRGEPASTATPQVFTTKPLNLVF